MPGRKTIPQPIGDPVEMGATDIIQILQQYSGGVFRTMSATGVGDFDGEELVYEVSNDGTNYFQATDTNGTAIKLTADGGMTLQDEEHANTYLYHRLRMTNGGGSPDVTVQIAGGLDS